MRKLVFCAVVLAISVMVIADQPPMGEKGRAGQAGNSNTAILELLEKDPVTWEIVEGGAWGKMTHNLVGSTFDFVFNGHGLEPDTDYCLIYYPGTWPEAHCLACGTTNGGGNIHLAGSVDPQADVTGAKIWLVLGSDVDCDNNVMTAWNSVEYLFEQRTIDFDDTDV